MTKSVSSCHPTVGSCASARQRWTPKMQEEQHAEEARWVAVSDVGTNKKVCHFQSQSATKLAEPQSSVEIGGSAGNCLTWCVVCGQALLWRRVLLPECHGGGRHQGRQRSALPVNSIFAKNCQHVLCEEKILWPAPCGLMSCDTLDKTLSDG